MTFLLKRRQIIGYLFFQSKYFLKENECLLDLEVNVVTKNGSIIIKKKNK
jgi:hypothetical protein